MKDREKVEVGDKVRYTYDDDYHGVKPGFVGEIIKLPGSGVGGHGEVFHPLMKAMYTFSQNPLFYWNKIT